MADTNVISPPSTPPPGLINSGVPNSANVATYNPATATAADAKTTGYNAEAYTVAPNQTVAGQLKDIIASDSPLMQQAAANARGTMNERGLINSSTAITAGQSAVIDKALPIATSDAATFDRAAANSTTARNTAAGFKANAENTAGLQDAQLDTQTSQFNAGSKNTALSQASTASNQITIDELHTRNQAALAQTMTSLKLAEIDAGGKMQIALTDMTDKNKLLLQTSQNAGQYYNTMLQYMSSIMSDPKLDAGQKQQALNNSVTTLNDALDTMTSIANIPGVQSTLNFGELRVPDAVPYVPPPSKGGGLFG